MKDMMCNRRGECGESAANGPGVLIYVYYVQIVCVHLPQRDLRAVPLIADEPSIAGSLAVVAFVAIPVGLARAFPAVLAVARGHRHRVLAAAAEGCRDGV